MQNKFVKSLRAKCVDVERKIWLQATPMAVCLSVHLIELTEEKTHHFLRRQSISSHSHSA